MRYALVFALLIACASDPVDAAENCTELEQVRDTELDGIEDINEHSAFQDRVAERARELRGEALADGADTEAAFCAVLETERVVFDVFDNIGEGLTDTTGP